MGLGVFFAIGLGSLFLIAALVILVKFDSFSAKAVAGTPPTVEYTFDFGGFSMEMLAVLMLACFGYVIGTAMLPDALGNKIREVSAGLTAPPEKPDKSAVTWDDKKRELTFSAAPDGYKWVARFQGQPTGSPLNDLTLKVPPGIAVVDVWYHREQDRINGAPLSVQTK